MIQDYARKRSVVLNFSSKTKGQVGLMMLQLEETTKKMYREIFVKAAMPFPCIGILLIQGNLPRIFPVFPLNYASFCIPYLNLIFLLGTAQLCVLTYFFRKGGQMSYKTLTTINLANMILVKQSFRYGLCLQQNSETLEILYKPFHKQQYIHAYSVQPNRDTYHTHKPPRFNNHISF